MMKNSSKTLFLTLMVMSTIMVISSNNWLSMWMGLEINLMSFIPIMMKSKNNFTSEACMMYFLVQAMSSMILLLMISTNSLIMTSPIMINEINLTLLTISLLIKMGIAPFHIWMPEVMEKISWTSCLLIMTWQKIAPMMIMTNIIKQNQWIMLCMILSATISAIGGINQTSLRKIMAYSSISHSSWMITCMKFEGMLWMTYFIIYTVITTMFTTLMMKKSVFYINQMATFNESLLSKIMLITTMLSMGGMPPFVGFLPKWIVIQSMINNSMFTTIMMMIMPTLITLFYYMRMITPIMTMSFSTMKINQKQSNSMTYMMILNMTLPMMMTFSFQ